MFRRTILFAAAVLAATGALAQTPTRQLNHDGQNADRGAPPAVISQSISREANRLVAVEKPRFSLADTAAARYRFSLDNSQGRSARPARSNWSDVRRLDSGNELIVTVRGEPPRRYLYFLSADDVSLTVLNLTDPSVPAAAKETLIETATDGPDRFVRARHGETVQLNKQTQLGPDGFFVAGEKIARLDQIVDTIARDGIAELSLFCRHLAPHVRNGLIGGAGLGALTTFLLAKNGTAADRANAAGAALIGAVIGSGLGAAIGTGVGGSLPLEPDVIYRAATESKSAAH